ncbi:microtubule-associated protein tau isoform X2 [Aricia agestis]|uniref:microtubule-associated protein tau isoform X2 n=1 Tax=Aricia agestis TaxID=91739 RepID=UPI001C2017E1|nr:microtubule-associated protein tau isoform X2 [Aricia agestis]XP_041989182.1 microtubule-associated protein tau isoform X2 [Aricia agestis]
MEQNMQSNNVNRAPVESRPNSGFNNGDPAAYNQQVRPQLIRTDSRSSLSSQPQQQRPGLPPQQRPQFQPGGPVNNPPFGPRSAPPGPPNQRAPVPGGVPGSPQLRPQSPLYRPGTPLNQTPQSPRPINPGVGAPQRAPVPNNLQFGPRQPPQLGNPTTPEGAKPQGNFQFNGNQRPVSSPANVQITKQPSQTSLKSSDSVTSSPYKPVNLDNQNVSNDNEKNNKMDDITEMSGPVKGRSYSIAAAPGMPSPFKMEDDRRKSISSLSGRYDDLSGRSSGLDLIQEVKNSSDNIRSSKESIKSEVSNEANRENTDRPESRMSGSKMTESFMGSLSNLSKKKVDDDDDVVLQNNSLSVKQEESQNKTDLSDRSPSLTRSDESPEPKNVSQSSVISNKPQTPTPEPQRPKTPKTNNLKDELHSSEIKRVETPTKPSPKSPMPEKKIPTMTSPLPPSNMNIPTDIKTATTPNDSKKSTPRKINSAPKPRPKDGDNDSGVDESTQGNDLNGSPSSPTKRLPSKLPTKEKEKSSSSLKQSLSRSSSKSATAKTPENPLPNEKKKVPMNKIQVGGAPSPNIKAVKSKIGSLDNTTYKPGGGKVKIENRKLDFNKVTPKIAAKNEAYIPSGGTKKITTTKLEWNAKSKIGSLQNTSYKPGGGDKKIETVKLDFKEKAKPKVASTVNITHKPGGGDVKIENQKLEFKAQSKVGSLDNVKHKPGGGEVKIFDDKEYLKQVSGQSPLPSSHDHSRQEPEYLYSFY